MNMMDIWKAAAQPTGGAASPYPVTPGATPGPLYSAGNPPGLGAIYNPLAYGTRPQLPATTTDTNSQTSGWTTGLYNYGGLNQQASVLASSLMGGNVSQGTLDLLNQQSAGRNVGFGAGSPLTSAQFLAATGQLSENLALQGGQLYNSLLQNTPRTTTTSGSVTHDLSAEQAMLNAAPDPYAAAMANWAAMNQGLGLGGRSTTFARPGGGYSPLPPGAAPPGASTNPYAGGAFAPPGPASGGGGGGYNPYDWTGGGGSLGGTGLDGGMVDPWASGDPFASAYQGGGGDPGSGVLLPWDLQDWSGGDMSGMGLGGDYQDPFAQG